MMANTWQGEFPWQNLLLDSYVRHVAGRTLPAQRLRPLRHGRQRLGVDGRLLHAAPPGRGRALLLRAPQPARARRPTAAISVGQPGETIPRRVTKGGSHLCAPNYCHRYRPAARQGEAVDTSTGTSASGASSACPSRGGSGCPPEGPPDV